MKCRQQAIYSMQRRGSALSTVYCLLSTFLPCLLPIVCSLFLLTLFAPSGLCADDSSSVLIKIHWDNLNDLATIESYKLDIRHCSQNAVLVSVHPDQLQFLIPDRFNRGQGWDVQILDRGEGPDEYYCALIDESHLPEISRFCRTLHVATTPCGPAILKISPDALCLLEPYLHAHYIQPLPHNISLRGWFPPPSGKMALPHKASPRIASLLQQVSAERIEKDVANLTYFDITKNNGRYNNEKSNLRTRFALRPETRDHAAGYIMDQLEDALPEGSVELIPFVRSGYEEYTLYNVVGTLHGQDPSSGYYAIVGHYDAIGGSGKVNWAGWRTEPTPGSDDNATGIAALIEAARILSQLEFPWTIKFIAFSGEELGLWGSLNFVSNATKSDENIIGVINLDMLGFNSHFDRVEIVGNRSSAWIIDLLLQAKDTYDIDLIVDTLVDPNAGFSDHESFWRFGYDAVMGIENFLPNRHALRPDTLGHFPQFNRHFHTIDDVADSLNFPLVSKVAKLCVAGLAQLAIGEEPQDEMPDLAIFGRDEREVGALKGHVRFSEQEEALIVPVNNISTSSVEKDFTVKLSICKPDSTECTTILSKRVNAPISGGSNYVFKVPWNRPGDVNLLIQVDPDNEVAEEKEDNNTIYEALQYMSPKQIVYPNPFIISRTEGARVTFSGLPIRSTVSILTLSGELVWEKQDSRNDRFLKWDGTNGRGFFIASGTYFYIIRDQNGDKVETGKIAVIRQD